MSIEQLLLERCPVGDGVAFKMKTGVLFSYELGTAGMDSATRSCEGTI